MHARFVYTGIRVRDLEESIRFYTSILGMTVRSRGEIEETRGVVVDLVSERSDHPLELNFYPPDSPFAAKYDSGESLDHLGFRVEDLDAAIAEARTSGYPVVQEIRSPTRRWVYLRDPNGIWIELSE